VREAKENILVNVLMGFIFTNGRKHTEYMQSIQRRIREFSGHVNLLSIYIGSILALTRIS
jgi:hypothetical protein